MCRRTTYLGAIEPSGWSEAQAVPKGVHEDEDDADDVRRPAAVIREHQRQRPVELCTTSVRRLLRDTPHQGHRTSRQQRTKEQTYEHAPRHRSTPNPQRNPPPRRINNQHLDDREPNLERRLGRPRHQRRPRPDSQAGQECGEVVLHCGGSAHLCHEVEERGAPEAG